MSSSSSSSSIVEKNDVKEKHLTQLSASIQRYTSLLGSRYADFTVCVQGEEFVTQRLLLHAGCDFFQGLFESQLDEARNARVTLSEVTNKEHFRTVLHFVCTGQVEASADWDRFEGVLAIAHYLQVKALVRYFWQKAVADLRPDSFVQYWNLAECYDQENVVSRIVSFVARQFYSAWRSRDFLALTVAQVERVVRSSQLISPVDTTLTAILTWTDKNECHQVLERLVSLVDLNLVSTSHLVNLLNKPNTLRHLEVIRDPLRRIGAARLGLDTGWHLDNALLAVASVEDTAGVSLICAYDYERNTWTEPRRLPFDMHHGMVLVKGSDEHVYVVGGGPNLVATNRVYKYNWQNNTVTYARDCLWGLYRPGAIEMNGLIYLVGGKTRHGVSTGFVQCYDPKRDQWREKEQTLTLHDYPVVSGGVDDDSFFIVGSYRRRTVERYSCRLDTWTTVASIPGPEKPVAHSVAVFADKILLVRESCCPCEAEVYDPARDEWLPDKLRLTGTKRVRRVVGLWKKEKKLPFIFVVDAGETMFSFDPVSSKMVRLTQIVFPKLFQFPVF